MYTYNNQNITNLHLDAERLGIPAEKIPDFWLQLTAECEDIKKETLERAYNIVNKLSLFYDQNPCEEPIFVRENPYIKPKTGSRHKKIVQWVRKNPKRK